MSEEASCAEAPAPSGASATTAGTKRKHRPGLQRVSIACERCRTRKNKCDRKVPECSTCMAAGATCVVVDRVTNRQFPRGHVQELELEVERLRARVAELELHLECRNDGLQHAAQPPAASTAGSAVEPQGTPASVTSSNPYPHSSFGNFANDLGAVPRDATPGQRQPFASDSSCLLFSSIVESTLLHADYTDEHGPPSNALQLRIAGWRKTPNENRFSFPNLSLAKQLQDIYFTFRWPTLPLIHRPSFLERHFRPSVSLQHQANDVSLFLTLMVLALGAIDFRRQHPGFGNVHVEYFQYATENYLHSLLKEDSIQTVQGLLLVALFAINEQQSTNAWLVSGQAIRIAINLGLHRKLTTTSADSDLVATEMRKRVFWSAYALDRNISISLSRPCAMRDEDINNPLPENLTDDELTLGFPPIRKSPAAVNHPLDMSTFIHIIKLRQIQSRIQALFYSADTTQVQTQGIEYHQTNIRLQLEQWIVRAPRYSPPTKATFQSTDWFQIAYSHALLLLYRPSPANLVVSTDALQTCADSAISLISSYSSLYAKNKITYTWIALHSLFMASITMLYTLFISPEIRASTTKAVVKSNVVSCLALFEVMAEFWPLSTRCHDIIERIGNYAVTLFDTPGVSTGEFSGQSDSPNGSLQHFGQIDAEFMEWFGTRTNHDASPSTQFGNTIQNDDSRNEIGSVGFAQNNGPIPMGLDMSLGNLEDLFPAEFDTSIPMMITAFGNEMQVPMQAPRQPEASEFPMEDLSTI